MSQVFGYPVLRRAHSDDPIRPRRASPFSRDLQTVGEAGCQLEWVYSAQILCFLVADQINDARFCWKRVPRNLAGSEEIQGVRGLLEALWEKDYVRFHGLTQSRQWSDLLSSLVAALVEATRSRTIRVVSEAYTTISLNDLAKFLSCTGDVAAKVAESHAWALDASTGMLKVTPPSRAQGSTQIPENSLEEMTKYVVHLDMQN